MEIIYEKIWTEDEATLGTSEHVDSEMMYKQFSGEELDRHHALTVMAHGRGSAYVLSTGYIVGFSPGGIYKLADVLTQSEIMEMVRALGGPEFLVRIEPTMNDFTPTNPYGQKVWKNLVRLGYAKTEKSCMSMPPLPCYEVTNHGKKELRRLYAIGRLTF